MSNYYFKTDDIDLYLKFSIKNRLLQPYYDIFCSEILKKLWSLSHEEDLKLGIKKELRKIKMKRLTNET